MRDEKLGLIDNWLRHVQDVRNRNRDELGGLQDEHARMMRLCELNVLSQAINVAETTLLQDAWGRGQEVAIHSLIYGLDNGILRQLGPSLAAPAAVEQRKRSLGW
jgi:carbonic anhydrase